MTGLKNGLKNLKATFTNAFKGPLNGVIKLVNNMVGKINDKLLISVGSTLSNVLSALGVSVTNGQYQLFSIPTIPELEKGGVLKSGGLKLDLAVREATRDGALLAGGQCNDPGICGR